MTATAATIVASSTLEELRASFRCALAPLVSLGGVCAEFNLLGDPLPAARHDTFQIARTVSQLVHHPARASLLDLAPGAESRNGDTAAVFSLIASVLTVWLTSRQWLS
jgi:hypothetical protein